MKEIWKDIKGYEKLYKINNSGVVINSKGKTLLTFKDERGYLKISLSKNGKINHTSIHRLIAISFIENKHNYPQVNHINGIKTDNRIENLEWCTDKQNKIHAYKHNLYPQGEHHSKSKITEIQAVEIFNSKESQSILAKKYGLTKGTIWAIKKGITWKKTLNKEKIGIEKNDWYF